MSDIQKNALTRSIWKRGSGALPSKFVWAPPSMETPNSPWSLLTVPYSAMVFPSNVTVADAP